MNSGVLDEHDLPGLASFLLGNVDDSEDAVACGLRFRRDDSQLLADQRIQQRALSGIGATENANESGVEGHGNRVQVPGARCQVPGPRNSGSWIDGGLRTAQG